LSYSEVCYWMREFAQAANRQKMPGDQDGPWFHISLENSGRARGNAKCIGSTAGRDIPRLSMNCLLYPNICASFEIPILEMDSSLSIRQRQEEVNVNGKLSAHFAGQSAMTKVSKLLDRGRVLDYGRQFTHWILAIHRPGDGSENSRDDWCAQSTLTVLSALLSSLFQISCPKILDLLRSTS
jgi:hypothetical protein